MTKMEEPEMKRGSSKKQKKRLEETRRRLEQDWRKTRKTRGRLEEKLEN